MNHNIFDKIVKKFSRQGYHLVIKTGHPETNEIIKIHDKVYTDRLEVYKKIEDVIYSEATRDSIFNYEYLCNKNTKIEDYLKPQKIVKGIWDIVFHKLKDDIKEVDVAWINMKQLFREELERKKYDTHFKMQLSVILNLFSRCGYDIDPNNSNDIWIKCEEIEIV